MTRSIDLTRVEALHALARRTRDTALARDRGGLVPRGCLDEAIRDGITARRVLSEELLEAMRVKRELDEARRRLAVIIDEAFGMEPVQSLDDLLTTLERRLSETRQERLAERREAEDDDLVEAVRENVRERNEAIARAETAEAALAEVRDAALGVILSATGRGTSYDGPTFYGDARALDALESAVLHAERAADRDLLRCRRVRAEAFSEAASEVRSADDIGRAVELADAVLDATAPAAERGETA